LKANTGRRPEHSIDVAAGLVFRRGKLLITQRRLDDHLAGLWEFPGGKVEPNESFQTCLTRELREELGIEIHVHEEIEDITHAYPEKTVRLKFFRCAWVSGQAQPIHCKALAWITREELGTFEFPAADARLLHILEETPQLWDPVENDT
jgi:mutator protein MutT